MIQPPAPNHGPSLLLIEGGLTGIALALAFCWPRLGSALFARVERAFSRLARRKSLAVAVVGAAALLLRLALLPVCPIPSPYIPDDFSFLLAANTFASGRLTNPTPAMWTHFESIHITMQPTYMSMYFPAQGLILAAGKVLTGHAWFGLLCVTALMCATICWMLQGWLPPTWALLGGALAILRLGLFSFWINTYTGAGSVAALGGALVLGALPRLMRRARLRDGILLAVGVIVLALSRPYEGLLLCLPVAFILGRWLFTGKNRPPASVLMRRAALPLLLIFAAAAWMGYYNDRAFGNPLTLPYKIDRATYAVAPYFVWQSPRPAPVYRHKTMRDFYTRNELAGLDELHTPSGFLLLTLTKAERGLLFFSGIVLLPPLIMLRRVFLDRRIRFLLLCVAVLLVGALGEVIVLSYYVAPFTAAFYAIGLQAMRHLRQWKPGSQPIGIAIVRLTVVVCFAMAPLSAWAKPLHLDLATSVGPLWACRCHDPGPFGIQRAKIETALEQLPGKQLVIVRYSPDHEPMNEWVYNAPDIDAAKVIWARDMSASDNLALIRYYKNRSVWLVQPDTQPVKVTPYFSQADGGHR